MTPLDEAPEQRWRRTVDGRNRPAKLKVDRLLREFGYAQLDAEAADAIEARLAAVALAVAPSLRDVLAGEVVTIHADDGAAGEEEDPRSRTRATESGSVTTDARPADAVPAEEPAVAAEVARMVSYLKQQVFDARAEAERLRTELDRLARQAASERQKDSVIAEQAAALEEQRRQLAELGAALIGTQEALAETRDEIRRAVGELQTLPESEALDGGPASAAEEPEFDFDPPLPASEDEPSGGRSPSVGSSDKWLPVDRQTQVDDRPVAAAAPAATADEPGPDPGFVSALPPPPPAPPSPWAGEANSPPPPAGERAALGKASRGRGGRGRGRGRWEGSCSICGRLPLGNRRKDLEAAGWGLDDEAAACPQCRGVG